MRNERTENPCASSSRRLFCRITAPLFNALFMKPGEKPPFLLARRGRYWFDLDERGRLLSDPTVSIEDEKTWQQNLNRGFGIVVALGMIVSLSIPLYIFLRHEADFHPLNGFDAKTFRGTFILTVMILSLLLMRLGAGLARRIAGRHTTRPAVPLWKRLPLRVAFIMPLYRPADGLPLLAATVFFGWALIDSWRVFAAYPPTPFVTAHKWMVSVWIALFGVLVAFVLLANVVFWPCLECRGLRAEDFLYDERKE